jgi:hypothetical protein
MHENAQYGKLIGAATVFILAWSPLTIPADQEFEPREKPATASETLSRLASTDSRVRERACKLARRQRKELAEGLCQLVAKPPLAASDEMVRHNALILLSEVGQREAIPLLIANVDWSGPFAPAGAEPFAGYPCAMDLLYYGASVRHEILAYLHGRKPSDVSDKAMELYAWLFERMFRDDIGGYAFARGIIVDAGKKNAHLREHRNIGRLLTKFDEVVAKVRGNRDIAKPMERRE